MPEDATAVVVNLAGVTPTAGTFLGATPDGQLGTSSINLDPGATRANLALVAIGRDGAIRIFNHVGSVHVVVDVQGWFGPQATGRYVALASPRRVLDSRQGGGPLGPGASRTVSFVGTDVPSDSSIAVLFNLAGVLPTAATFLSAWPHGGSRPLASNVNLDPGTIVPNAAISNTSTVDVYNNAGSTDIVVDVAGFFYTPTRPNSTLPGAPQLLEVRAVGDHLRIEWFPGDDGGVPFTSFTVTVQPGGRTVTVDSSQREVALTGLVPDVYTVTVTATNLIGTGPASTPSRPTLFASMTRVDTDASGVPDQFGDTQIVGLSGDGRYVLLGVRSNSILVPAAYRAPTDQGLYLVRKDIRTGELILAGITASGSPVLSSWSAKISQDGTTFAYSSVNEGPSVLYVRDVANNTLRSVPTVSGATNVALSTDGRWLSWVSNVNEPVGRRIYRHDLHTNQTSLLLDCDRPSSGCYLYDGPAVSNDAKKYVLEYRPTPNDPILLMLLDPETGTLRTLPEGEQGDDFTISGDGNWVFYTRVEGCPSCGDGSWQLKKIATTPDSSPIEVRSWQDIITMAVGPSSVSDNGRLVGYWRQTRTSGKWFIAAPGYVLDQETGREVQMPDVRDISYSRGPTLSANGRVAVFNEECLFLESCRPVGTYAISLP